MDHRHLQCGGGTCRNERSSGGSHMGAMAAAFSAVVGGGDERALFSSPQKQGAFQSWREGSERPRAPFGGDSYSGASVWDMPSIYKEKVRSRWGASLPSSSSVRCRPRTPENILEREEEGVEVSSERSYSMTVQQSPEGTDNYAPPTPVVEEEESAAEMTILEDVDVSNSTNAMELVKVWTNAVETFIADCKTRRIATKNALQAILPLGDAVTEIAKMVVNMDGQLKVAQAKGGARLAEMERLVLEQRKEHEDLQQVLRTTASALVDIKRGMSAQGGSPLESQGTSMPASWASRVKASKAGEAPVPAPRTFVVVRPKKGVEDLQSADKVEKALTTAVNPAERGWQVVGMRKRRGKEVVLEAPSVEEARRIMADCTPAVVGLEMDLLTKRRPTIIVQRVGAGLAAGELAESIRRQNFPEVKQESFANSLRVIRPMPRGKEGPVDWLIEVEPDLFKRIMLRGSLYVGYSACSVSNRIPVIRCFKCARFGHFARECKVCKEGEHCCSRCGEKGHVRKDCKVKTKDLKCPACCDAKKPGDHEMGSEKCWVFARARQMVAIRTDYGQH